MKTKNIILIALLVLLTGMASCKKDHDIPTGKVFNGGSGGGSTTDSLTISVTANPSEGGTVSGGGKYLKGKTCVVAASANEGYVFSNWTENGTQVSTSVTYSFTVNVDRTLVANFSVSTGNNFTITALASPEYGGVISGSGTYQQGQTCTLTATAEADYTFVNWTENGSQVSTEASYTFTVTGNRTLVANFTLCDYSNIILNEINGNDKFIEIYNSGTVAINLNGVYLEKDGMQNWVADNTVRIEAGDYLLLYSEDVQFDHPDWPEALIFHSGISAKKNVRIQLFSPTGVSIGDFNLTNIDLNGEAYGYVGNAAPASYSRNADGNWYYAEATPGGANVEGTNLVLGLEGGYIPEPSSFSISVSASPSNGGMVSGGGTYQEGQSCTVIGTANNGYTFTNWTENGNQVSEDASYTFVVTSNRTLIANFAFVQGEGSGTFEDPYNVVAGIGLQSEEPIAWVHGYIVGAVKSGLSSVTSNADINWSAPFDLVTNVVIADDVFCREISQCIIVNLPAGKPLRTQVNLMDNPDNLGKHLAVNGKLRKYFGQAGLRDSNGTEADFVLEGVTPPTPGTVVFSESFGSGQGQFTIQDVFLPQELSYVWCHDSQFSFMRASAFVVQDYATESWLISPVINLSGVSSAKLTFSQAVNYASPQGALFMMISTNYNGSVSNATWTELNLDQWPAGNNWTFITSTADLTPYVGQTVTIAFKFTSDSNASATWEVKNFVVE